MLNFILGRQKTGKTYRCTKLADELVSANKKVIMLVPEQYSFECQKNLLEELGPQKSNAVIIHSFTSLCEEILSVNGGVSGYNVDDATRYILVGQAIKNVKDNLKIYSKYAESSSFINQMLSVFTEFKQTAVSVEDLKNISEKLTSEAFVQKLHDITLIYSAYEALLQHKFIDPLDLIDRTVQSMADNSFFKNTTVIIDEFKGFTESQIKLLDRVIAGCTDVFVSLCCDSLLQKGETDLFGNVKIIGRRLKTIAESHGVGVLEEKLENKSYSQDIIAFEEFLSENSSDKFDEPSGNIKICSAENVYSEVDFVMNTIRRLVREEGLRYRDFVIISRSDGVYSSLIDEVSELYNIPCFTDKRVPMSSLPFTVFILAAIKAAISFETDDIMRMAKTGLAGLDNTEISRIENYAYIWNINGKKWLSDWNMNPEGLKTVTSEKDAERFKNDIDSINSIRKRLIIPLNNLRDGLVGTPEQMCTALFKFIEQNNTPDLLKNYVKTLEENGFLQEAELQSVCYDCFIKALDKIVSSLDDSKITASEFLRILTSVVGFETVGDIPRTLDQVMYGTADRIKPMRPKVVFLVGVNQDIFPSSVSDTGLLSVNEREQLINGGIKVADHGINDCLDEKFLLYFSANCASDKVYICYSKASLSGSALEPSMEISWITDAFPNAEVIDYGSELKLSEIETEAEAFRKFAEHFRADSEDRDTLNEYFKSKNGYADRVRALQDFMLYKKPSITRDSALSLYGEELNLSASKADDFAGCKFMYFCKYGIGAKSLNMVDFDPLTRGNIVHFCLEHFVKNHIADIGSLDNDAIRLEAFDLCDRYLEENSTDTSAFDEKFLYMMEIVKDTAATLCIALNNEFKVSAFRPKFCELKVADDQPVKGVDVLTDSGNRVTLTGYVDRVDVTDDGKVRVIDYKTGSKGDGLKLSELLNGQNMQMLLYLYSILKNGQEYVGAEIPAGVLYFPAKRSVSDSASDYIRMNGVVADDIETVSQMEPTLQGKIIPVHKRETSDSFYSTESMISQEAFKLLFRYIELLLKKIGNVIMSGDISPRPLKISQKLKCEFCDYRSVCRFDPYRDFDDAVDCRNKDALDLMKKEIEEIDNGN